MARRQFRDLPIRRKLLLATLASNGVAVVLAGCGFLAWDVVQFRTEIREDVLAQARIVAEASGSALTFRDERRRGRPSKSCGCGRASRWPASTAPAINCLPASDAPLADQCSPLLPRMTNLGWTRFDVSVSVASGATAPTPPPSRSERCTFAVT